MTEQDRQNFVDNLNRKVKDREYQPTYAGEVQEVKKHGHTVVARRSVYNSTADQIVWNAWEVY